MNVLNKSWIKSCKSYTINMGILEAYLYAINGNVQFNRLKLYPLFKNVELFNNDGFLQYAPDKEQDDNIMNKLFPTYVGETVSEINIKKCIMLSVDVNKYNKIRNETLQILKMYNLPNIEIYFGYTSSTITNSRFYEYMYNKQQRNELTCGMLEIFEKFVSESIGNEWLLFFEDDVRPVNIDNSDNLNLLHNIPKDAELIRPYIGCNKLCKLIDLTYKKSFGGGLNHAFYISTTERNL